MELDVKIPLEEVTIKGEYLNFMVSGAEVRFLNPAIAKVIQSIEDDTNKVGVFLHFRIANHTITFLDVVISNEIPRKKTIKTTHGNHQEKIERTSIISAKKANPENTPNQEQIEQSSAWEHLKFREKVFIYKTKAEQFHQKNQDSKAYLEAIKSILPHFDLTYQIVRMNGKIKQIVLPEQLTEIVRIGKILQDIQIPDPKRKIKSFKLSQKISLDRILRILRLSKSWYLEQLGILQDQTFSIICIPEAVIQHNRSVRRDVSFLFTIKVGSRRALVWESVEVNKATYIFRLETNSNAGIKALTSRVESFLMSDKPHIRSRLRTINARKALGARDVISLNHDYDDFDLDYTWLSRIRDFGV